MQAGRAAARAGLGTVMGRDPDRDRRAKGRRRPGFSSESTPLSPGAGAGALQEDESVAAFLSRAVEPPPALAVRQAIRALVDVGAVAVVRASGGGEDEDERPPREVLTALGRALARLPMAPRLAKTVLVGCVLRCLDPVLTVACAMADRSPFVMPMHSRDRDRADASRAELCDGARSDHLALLGAYRGYE